MADINPQTTFHIAANEREYALIMLGLSVLAGAKVNPSGHHRRDAANLNRKLLELELKTWHQRITATDRKLTIAPPSPDIAAREQWNTADEAERTRLIEWATKFTLNTDNLDAHYTALREIALQAHEAQSDQRLAQQRADVLLAVAQFRSEKEPADTGDPT